MFGCAATSAAITAFIAFWSSSKPSGGQCVPATWRSGLRARSTPAAASAVPGAPPSRKIDRPRAAAAALRLEIKSEPATRSGSGVRCNRLAHTSGMPSATTTLASSSSALNVRSCAQRRR
jgi:hypothetical protein